MSLPETVALTCCPAEDALGEIRKVSGLYDIVERYGVEPSNYVHSPGYLIAAIEDRESDDGEKFLWVDEYVLLAQADPHAYGRMLAQERWLDLAEQDAAQ